MGKTHEALLRAEQELQKKLPQLTSQEQKSLLAYTSDPRKKLTTPKWYEELKTKLQTQHPNGSIKTIMFAGSVSGEGTSTTAFGFASSLAESYQMKVLLMDLNFRKPGINKFPDMKEKHGLMDVFLDTNGIESFLKGMNRGNLYVITNDGHFSTSTSFFESEWFATFLQKMRDSYDYVIIDSPPVTSFADAQIIGPRVDGVILILEAGKTRRQVALKAKTEIEAAGGKLLGVVLNKRKYYIPKWIYKRL
jgi:capsular exopolysaccharide synthesis family protein